MKRDKPAIWQRRWTVWHLHEQGTSLQWIADACGVSKATVCTDLTAVRDLQDTHPADLDQHARRVLDRVRARCAT
jgi:hypothetical protein